MTLYAEIYQPQDVPSRHICRCVLGSVLVVDCVLKTLKFNSGFCVMSIVLVTITEKWSPESQLCHIRRTVAQTVRAVLPTVGGGVCAVQQDGPVAAADPSDGGECMRH